MSEAPFPARGEVDWSVMDGLADQDHPLVNNSWSPPDPDTHYAAEMFCEIKISHHLLDRAGVPHGYSMDTMSIDCRVLLLVQAYLKLRDG